VFATQMMMILSLKRHAANQGKVENDKKFIHQSNKTGNNKNDFQLAESLTSSSEATGDPKETWADEHYKPPWGWDPIPFPEDPSWAENNEINERLARERAISGGSSTPPPKLPENNLFSGALITGLRTAANHSDKELQQNKDPHNHIPIVTVMWKPKARRNTGCPFPLGLIVDGTIRTKQGRLCIPWQCTAIAVQQYTEQYSNFGVWAHSCDDKVPIYGQRCSVVCQIEPFRRYLWSKGRLSEPSWSVSWVDSPEHHCEKKISFFFNSSFCCFYFFFPHHQFSCFCHVHSSSCPAQHMQPPTTLLHTHLAPILPYTSPPPVPLAPISNPFKTLSFYA
jgi:hypothetical protein